MENTKNHRNWIQNGKHRKLWKTVFLGQKNPRKSLFLEYFKVKLIIIVELLWKFKKKKKNFIVKWYRPTLQISALSDTAFLKNMLSKIPENQWKLQSQKITEFYILENRKLATLGKSQCCKSEISQELLSCSENTETQWCQAIRCNELSLVSLQDGKAIALVWGYNWGLTGNQVAWGGFNKIHKILGHSKGSH